MSKIGQQGASVHDSHQETQAGKRSISTPLPQSAAEADGTPALKAFPQKGSMSLQLTFHWPKQVLWPYLMSKGVEKYSPTMFLMINSLTLDGSQTFISSPDPPSELRPLCPTASLTFLPRLVYTDLYFKVSMTKN